MNILKKTVLAASAVALMSGAAFADDVKVGSVAGVTGPIAELVVPILAGRALAAVHVNAQGGLHAGDTMKLIVADSACDPKGGVDAGEKVVNVEQVVAIVGASCSGATNGLVSSVAIPAGVAAISDSATAPSITDLEDDNLVFRVAPSDAYQGAALAQYAFNDGVKTIAIMYANDDYNAGIAEVFEASFKALGGTVTSSQAHEPQKPSYRGELATLQSAGDATTLAVFAYYGSSGITVIKNSLENGLFTDFYGADGMYDISVIEQIGADTLRGHISLSQSASDYNDASYQAFATEFTEHDPKAPYAAMGYDATFLIALAIEQAGSNDRRAVADELMKLNVDGGMVIRPGQWAEAKAAIAAGKDINYEGASGSVDFDANGDVAGLYGINTVGDDDTWANKRID